MDTTRRSFLKGLFAVTAVATAGLPSFVEAVPRIVGDGVHDDWAGLQACFDGRPFTIEGENIIAADAHLSGGIFRMTRTLVLSGDRFIIQNAHFICDDIKGAALHTSGKGGIISNVCIGGAADIGILVGT